MESDSLRMCERLVGLPDVNVLAVDERPGSTFMVIIESRCESPLWTPRLSNRPLSDGELAPCA